MKSINDSSNSDDRNNNHNNNNWLGFSLSPQLKMEVSSAPPPSHHHHHYQQHHHYHHQHQPSSASNTVPTPFYFSSSHFNNCYENGNLHSPLTVMPLKSDGSLCIMEALGRSQPQGFLFFFLLQCY